MLENVDENFEVGDFVFAKLKGHPHWPATISQIETVHANGNERTKYNVYFYGSHQMSLIKVESIVKFDDQYGFLKKKYASNPKFIAALEELEADLETRKSYLQSLRECLIESERHVELQDKPEDEMFSVSEESYHEPVSTVNEQLLSTEVSSGFSEGYVSDEDCQSSKDKKHEILSMEKILFPGTPDIFLIISLGFNEENLREDFEYIENQLRMMQCYVKLERLPNNLDYLSDEAPLPGQVDLFSKAHHEWKCVQMTSETRLRMKKERLKGTQVVQPVAVTTKYRGRRKKTAVRSQPQVLTGKGHNKEYNNKFKNSYWNNKPTLTFITAEAVKRRRQRRKKPGVPDETRVLSLRQRGSGASQDQSTSTGTGDSSCLPEQCNYNEIVEPNPIIICPICQAQFSSSVDFKQHSFNIHIMGL